MMHLYSILTMGWMYATPLFYPITALPETLQKLLKLNPLYHYINLFRNLMMYGNIPGPNTWIACNFLRRCLYGYWPVGVPQAAKELYPVYLT